MLRRSVSVSLSLDTAQRLTIGATSSNSNT
jgi:hypothetical protein